MNNENNIILHQDDNEITRISVRFADEDLWLTQNLMTMKDWVEALDNQIIAHKRKVLVGKGSISHKQAIEKAEKEFEIYRKREMMLYESDFDKEIKKIRRKD